MENLDQIKYQEAVKRVKKIKGFYTHLLVYLVINIAIILSKVDFDNNSTWSFEMRNFSTAFFWGIGLVVHGFTVFGPALLLGKNWEEKKIKELMEKEKTNM